MAGKRAPAIPLIVHDPYFSIWSPTDRLTDSWPMHWSGRSHQLAGMIRVDGNPFRFLGKETANSEASIPAIDQQDYEVLPTRTRYRFQAGGIELVLSFVTPVLADDLDLLARPLTYVSAEVVATDRATHAVELYLDAAAALAVGTPEEQVIWGRHRAGEVEALWIGTKNQPVLERAGDEITIDWGYLQLSARPGQGATGAIGEGLTLRSRFARDGRIEARDDVGFGARLAMPAPAATVTRPDAAGRDDDRSPLVVAAWAIGLGSVGATPARADWCIAYDQVLAVEYFGRRLPPLWRTRHGSAVALIERAWAEQAEIKARAVAFDEDLLVRAEQAGGPVYARLVSLAYRQCLGGHSLVRDLDGRLLYFSKENSSNGCMATVDITYPTSPFFLLLNPALLEAQLEPVCALAASGMWPFPFAPHDVGRFPRANGQVYGGGIHTLHRQMPVEECGNMLLCVAGLVQRTGDTAFAERYWLVLESWAGYLAEHGLDPENQLCTDDFAGHLAHNTNLSIKAILALGAWAQLCQKRGLGEAGEHYRGLALGWAGRWQEMALDGDHYRLTFNGAGSWSQKYNLIWDRLLGLALFPPEVAKAELATYRRRQNAFGLPLDSRSPYTKLDWILWTACLTGDPGDFAALVEPLGHWLDATEDRVPLTDWYFTDTGRLTHARGFRARTVVGAVFVKLLLDDQATAP
jgi:hypothetical protein